ncbi:hypothetical protein [Hydrogenophaga defluvii]|uniref:Uncharacterized protein n=1 Tax=Hydrogenophaga defluvii TaxID=249410 RepID=A0ABW2SF14_9BURK
MPKTASNTIAKPAKSITSEAKPTNTFITVPLPASKLNTAPAAISTDNVVKNILSIKNIDYDDVSDALQTIQSAADQWATTELAASHARLYRILTTCYEFYLAMKSGDTVKDTRKAMQKGLTEFIKSRGMKTLDKTHDMNRVVKAVFGNDRRRVSAYSIALRAALIGTDKLTPVPAKDLADWIAEKGGVEEIRSGKKKAGPTPTERAAMVKDHFDFQTPLMPIKPDARVMPYGTNDVDKVSLLVVTFTTTGELEINAVVKNDSAVNAALAIYYSEIATAVEQSKAKAAKTTRSSTLASGLSTLSQ